MSHHTTLPMRTPGFAALILAATVFLVCILSLAKAKTSAPSPYNDPLYKHAPAQLLVKFDQTLNGATPADIASQVGGHLTHHSVELDFYRVEFPMTANLAKAIGYFRSLKEVVWANYNYIADEHFVPNDQYYQYQWHYPLIGLESAWDVTRGAANITVAVCDQGWQFNHEDFAGVQVVSPRDTRDEDNDPEVPSLYESHGMHVAGTILAATNNGVGVAGIAPNCLFMPIRVMNDEHPGSGTSEDIAEGIVWAAQHGAHVLNLSLGYTHSANEPPPDPGPPLSTAIQTAANAGVVICVSSGNSGYDYVAYPAAYPVCIAVGASATNDAIAPYSNQGSELDVAAPGGNTEQDLNGDTYPDGVLSSFMNQNLQSDYWFWQGTSMAAPHVAGVAALCLANGVPANCVREALENTAVDLGAGGWDVVFGHGRINANSAIRYSDCGGGGGETTIFYEPFNATPAGWTQDQNDAQAVGWNLLADLDPDPDCADNPQAGANAIWHDDENLGQQHQDDWLRSPVITLPAGATDMVLTFWQRNCYLPNFYEYHGLLYRFDGAQQWSEFSQYDDPQEDWQQISVTLDNNTAGHTVEFAFRYQGVYATEWFIDEFHITGNTDVAADDRQVIALQSMQLGASYPNPFNNSTNIPFELSHNMRVTMTIHNVLGQEVAVLVNDAIMTAGTHRIQWNAESATSGVYLVRLLSEGHAQTAKLLLVK